MKLSNIFTACLGVFLVASTLGALQRREEESDSAPLLVLRGCEYVRVLALVCGVHRLDGGYMTLPSDTRCKF